jgi:hypothetical protein
MSIYLFKDIGDYMSDINETPFTLLTDEEKERIRQDVGKSYYAEASTKLRLCEGCDFIVESIRFNHKENCPFSDMEKTRAIPIHHIKIWDMGQGMTWIAAADRLDALLAMAHNFGYAGEDNFGRFLNDHFGNHEIEEIQEISPDDYENLFFTRDEDDLQEGEALKISFRERLNEMIADKEIFPCFFATTEE